MPGQDLVEPEPILGEEKIPSCKATHRAEEWMAARHLAARGRMVLSTPCLILMIEITTRKCLEKLLGDGRTSVGYRVDIRHRKPVPIGSEVEIEARLVEFDGRRAVFYAKARSGGQLVAEAVHERYVTE